MERSYSLGNAFKNMTGKQKIAFGLVFVIIVVLVVVLLLVIGTPNGDNGEADGDYDVTDSDYYSEEATEPEDETTELENGIVGASVIGSDVNGDANAMVPVSVDYNEDHDYLLIDYIPISKYDYITYGNNQHGVRAYWIINENTAIDKGLVISVDSCDVEGNNAAANEYLRSLPVDLSDYVFVYRVHEGNVPCNIR